MHGTAREAHGPRGLTFITIVLSTAAVLADIEHAFTARGTLTCCKVRETEIVSESIKLSLIANRKFKVYVEGVISTSRKLQVAKDWLSS